MADGTVNFGGGGVEVDGTFISREPGKEVKRGGARKMKVLSLEDRAPGRAKSIVVDDLKTRTHLPIRKENIAKEAAVHTDDALQYTNLGKHLADHDYSTATDAAVISCASGILSLHGRCDPIEQVNRAGPPSLPAADQNRHVPRPLCQILGGERT